MLCVDVAWIMLLGRKMMKALGSGFAGGFFVLGSGARRESSMGVIVNEWNSALAAASLRLVSLLTISAHM